MSQAISKTCLLFLPLLLWIPRQAQPAAAPVCAPIEIVKSGGPNLVQQGEVIDLCLTVRSPAETGPPLADIMWVIDRSGSMGANIDRIRSNMASLTHELANSGIDYRQGLVHFSRSITNMGFAADDAQLDQWMADINPSGRYEYSLEALLEANTVPWRDCASKTLILVTDEPVDCAEVGGGGITNTPLFMAQVAADLKAQNVVLHGITLDAASSTDRCNGRDLPTLTDGIWLDIQAPASDWSQFLNSLARFTATVRDLVIRRRDAGPR